MQSCITLGVLEFFEALFYGAGMTAKYFSQVIGALTFVMQFEEFDIICFRPRAIGVRIRFAHFGKLVRPG